MNTDIRISVGLVSHPKTVKLMRRCGDRAFYCLISLWTWAAQNRPDGILAGLDKEDISNAANFNGDSEKFIQTLLDLRLLDKQGDNFSIHDWGSNQPHLKVIVAVKRPYSKLWKKIKMAVFERDQGEMECDHAIPISRGGNNSFSNLVTSCPKCNRKKGTKTAAEFVGGAI